MKIRFLSICTLLFFSLSGYAQDTIQLIKYVSNLKKVDIVIQGHAYSFLFDTGGGETFISPEVAKRLGKPVYGNETSFRMNGEIVKYAKSDSITMKIGSTTIFHPSVGIWDIMSILPKGLPKIDGVLSLKSFKDKILTIDLAADELVLETKASFQKQRSQLSRLGSRFANGMNGNELTIFIRIPHHDRAYWFLFDSGNLNDFLLSHHTAYEWGLQSDSVTQRQALNAVKIQVGKKVLDSKAASEKIIYDGALNYALLRQSKYIINFPLQEVWTF